jgi:membrane protein implicated in regulation of membrane protease activity
LPTLHYSQIVIPGLAGDLERVDLANRLGLLQRTRPLLTLIAFVAASLLVILAGWRLLRRRHRSTPAS